MLDKWNNFWLSHPISNLILWNLIVLVPALLLTIDVIVSSTRHDGSGVGSALLLMFISPVVLITVMIDIYRLVKKLV
jgi:hypothetical protein